MKAWRAIRTILFAIFAIICLIGGYFDFKTGSFDQKAMYIVFVVGLIFFFPTLIKDLSSPYQGKKEPNKFVRRRILFGAASSAFLSIGIYLLIGHNPDNLAVLESQMGVGGLLIPLIFFVIFMVIHLILELFIFYLPRRLGYDGEPESEEEEAKTNKSALIITVVIVLLVIVYTFARAGF